MRKTISLLVLVVTVSILMVSCSSYRGASGGCKATQGYVGYGSR